MKDFGETSMNDNGLDTGEQAKAALGKVRDALSQQVNQHVESRYHRGEMPVLTSKWITKDISPAVVEAGLCRYKIMIVISPSQLGLTQQDNGLVSNVGVGQRWARGNWLVGYNTFMTTCWTKIFSERALVPKRGANICDYRQTLSAVCCMA